MTRPATGYGRLLRTVIAAALLVPPLLALTLRLLPGGPFEWLYPGHLYPVITIVATTLTGWTEWPLGIFVLPTAVGIFVVSTLLQRRLPLSRRLARLAILSVLLLSCYYLLWGANYRRLPLPQLIDLPATAPSDAELVALANDLLSWVESGAAADRSETEAVAAIAAELESLAAELGRPASLPMRLKTLPAGTLLGSGYAGMIFPFTLEPQVDGGLPPAARISTGAHELAHVAGFAMEADANLAGAIAGLRAEDEFARYATALSLLSQMLVSLPDEVRESLISRLPERARLDLAAAREQARRHLNPVLARRVTAYYDSFLVRQGVTGGVSQYTLLPRQAALARRIGLLPEPPAGDREAGNGSGAGKVGREATGNGMAGGEVAGDGETVDGAAAAGASAGDR